MRLCIPICILCDITRSLLTTRVYIHSRFPEHGSALHRFRVAQDVTYRVGRTRKLITCDNNTSKEWRPYTADATGSGRGSANKESRIGTRRTLSKFVDNDSLNVHSHVVTYPPHVTLGPVSSHARVSRRRCQDPRDEPSFLGMYSAHRCCVSPTT